jgi:hypothetical protein
MNTEAKTAVLQGKSPAMIYNYFDTRKQMPESKGEPTEQEQKVIPSPQFVLFAIRSS